jgi:UDP-N-acetylglucosamine--N-acetylmuramyl-(pentapeptide) pyrophosphoryl-undecaprenol N-acetylglucosamine transferase
MFPALALARSLLERGEPVTMVTDSRGARYLPEDFDHHVITDARGARYLPDDIDRHVIPAGSPTGSLGARLAGMLALGRGTLESIGLCRRLKPRAAACFGGYASVPVGIAARLAGRPILLHEQNAVFGRANRLLARFASTIALSFAATAHAPGGTVRRLVTGNPVRPGFKLDGAVFRAPAEGAPFRLLVIGGSQGARIFSDVVPAAVAGLPEALRRRLSIQQQCRPEDLARVGESYAALGTEAEVAAFFDDMPTRMAQAHLIVSRAGASSLAEIMAMGRPSILVPYAAAADDHQRANAEALAAAGGCVPILQVDFDANALRAELAALLAQPDRLEALAAAARAAYQSDAAAKLADAVLALLPDATPLGERPTSTKTEVAR